MNEGREVWMSLLGQKHITNYSVIKESKVYFLYEGGNKHINQTSFLHSPNKNKIILFFFDSFNHSFDWLDGLNKNIL